MAIMAEALKTLNNCFYRHFTGHAAYVFQVTSMVSIMICCGCLNMAAFHQKATTCSWATMLTAGSSPWRRYVYCLHTRSNILRTSSCCVETTSVQASTASTDSTMNVSAQYSCCHCLFIFCPFFSSHFGIV